MPEVFEGTQVGTQKVSYNNDRARPRLNQTGSPTILHYLRDELFKGEALPLIRVINFAKRRAKMVDRKNLVREDHITAIHQYPFGINTYPKVLAIS